MSASLVLYASRSTKGIWRLSTKQRVIKSECRALTVWGTNLTSQVGYGRLTKHERDIIKLPPYQLSVIIGLVLSDGWLRIATKGSINALLGFKQSLARSDYVWYVFSILSPYCNLMPRLTGGVRGGKRFYGLQIETRSLLCFTELYHLFYVKGVKVIPQNIYHLLTPVALAHFILGDGSWRPHGLIICTDSYSVQQVIILMNVLVIKYRLECTLRFPTPTSPRVYIKESSMPVLISIVSLYFPQSMYYKLRIGN